MDTQVRPSIQVSTEGSANGEVMTNIGGVASWAPAVSTTQRMFQGPTTLGPQTQTPADPLGVEVLLAGQQGINFNLPVTTKSQDVMFQFNGNFELYTELTTAQYIAAVTAQPAIEWQVVLTYVIRFNGGAWIDMFSSFVSANIGKIQGDTVNRTEHDFKSEWDGVVNYVFPNMPPGAYTIDLAFRPTFYGLGGYDPATVAIRNELRFWEHKLFAFYSSET